MCQSLLPSQHPLLRPLLLRFSDEAERCRDGAVGLFRRWQSQCTDASEVSGALPFLMPVMVERLGSESTHEPSEEVRASLVMLMRDVLLCARKLIRPYIAEVGSIALGCARGPAGWTCFGRTCRATGTRRGLRGSTRSACSTNATTRY